MQQYEGSLRNNPVVALLAEDDLEQGRLFWRDTVGLEEIYHDVQMGEAAFRCGGTVFAIYQHDGGSKADHTQLAFQVEDVRHAVQVLRDQGIRFEEYDLPNLKTQDAVADLGRMGQGAWFKDPGNNIVGLLSASTTLVRAIEARPVIEAGVM